MTILTGLGLFFRENREGAGLTLERVAAVIESLSVETLRAFENGEATLGVDDLFALTNLLNIDPEEFLARLQPAAIAALESDMERRLSEEAAQADSARTLPLRVMGSTKPK